MQHPFRLIFIRPSSASRSLFPAVLSMLIACLVYQNGLAQNHLSEIEIDGEKAHLVSVQGDESATVEIRELKSSVGIFITEDGLETKYEIEDELHRTIKVVIEKAKSAALNYVLDFEMREMDRPRKLIYRGVDGFDNVFINLDYTIGGANVALLAPFEVDLFTGQGRDHVNLEVHDIAATSAMDVDVQLGDQDDYFRFYLERGSNSHTGIFANVDAGAGNDRLFLEYFGSSVFTKELVNINYFGADGHDEMRWFSMASIEAPHFVQFFGGNGSDLILGKILGQADYNWHFHSTFSGGDGNDWVGVELMDSSPTFFGTVLLDGGDGFDRYFPQIKKLDDVFEIVDVEEFYEFLMDLF